MRFRPCIDLHDGAVKQIVGASLSLDDPRALQTNYTSKLPASHYAACYKRDRLNGGHVIMLGPGNEIAATQALAAYPNGLQVGGGITDQNAAYWLSLGASHLIVTSFFFVNGHLNLPRLESLVKEVGAQHLVLDLSCRQRAGQYYVVCDRWQTFTDLPISQETFVLLADYCAEFLIHGVDVEGKCMGVDGDLIARLAKYTTRPTTYAGGISSYDDLDLLRNAGKGRLDFTVGSSLDIFGGKQLSYQEMVAYSGPPIDET